MTKSSSLILLNTSISFRGVGDVMDSVFERPRIFRNRSVLDPQYVPDTLQGRDKEIKDLQHYLGYVLDGGRPPDLLVVGVPGSGKTTSVLYVAKQLSKVAENARILYTVADGTAYQVTAKLAREGGFEVPLKGLGFVEAWEFLKKAIDEGITIVVLDEIDKMLAKDGERLLYHLSRHPNTSIVAISNNLAVLSLIQDIRVSSSFIPRKIFFSPYDANQLENILSYRAEQAFYEGVLEESVIPLCAAMAAKKNGDARYALNLLSVAADVAIRRGSEKVTEEDVRIAEGEIEREFIRQSIERLSESQRILLYCVLDKKDGESPTNIYHRFNLVAKQIGAKALSQRRLSDLLKQLELLGFVDIIRRGRGRGKGVDWFVYPAFHYDAAEAKEVIIRSLATEYPFTSKDLLGGNSQPKQETTLSARSSAQNRASVQNKTLADFW